MSDIRDAVDTLEGRVYKLQRLVARLNHPNPQVQVGWYDSYEDFEGIEVPEELLVHVKSIVTAELLVLDAKLAKVRASLGMGQ